MNKNVYPDPMGSGSFKVEGSRDDAAFDAAAWLKLDDDKPAFHPSTPVTSFSYYAGDERQHFVTWVVFPRKWAIRRGTTVLRYRDNLVAALSELERVSGIPADRFTIDA